MSTCISPYASRVFLKTRDLINLSQPQSASLTLWNFVQAAIWAKINGSWSFNQLLLVCWGGSAILHITRFWFLIGRFRLCRTRRCNSLVKVWIFVLINGLLILSRTIIITHALTSARRTCTMQPMCRGVCIFLAHIFQYRLGRDEARSVIICTFHRSAASAASAEREREKCVVLRAFVLNI
jgi:hypothetical protein